MLNVYCRVSTILPVQEHGCLHTCSLLYRQTKSYHINTTTVSPMQTHYYNIRTYTADNKVRVYHFICFHVVIISFQFWQDLGRARGQLTEPSDFRLRHVVDDMECSNQVHQVLMSIHRAKLLTAHKSIECLTHQLRIEKVTEVIPETCLTVYK